MATIDDKVVAMSFESSKFESGINTAITALERLKKVLDFPKAGKGLDDINAASKRVDLSHIGHAVEGISGKFAALSVAAGVALANIAQKAVTAGINIAKAFTIDPMKAGFKEYSVNLNSIQTILANTEASGANLEDVNRALDTLNEYSDKTIYNFSQMAKNIGTFTAAGVDLDTSTQAIKGIANLAALSGSNADQASTAMYQLSQAISAGRVGLQDWNSVVNAGMGGTVFQRALATTAENMGTLKEGTLKLVGPMKNVEIAGQSFRQSMQAGPGKTSWLTSKVLTQTLKQFTGDLSDAELKAQGFNAAQIKAIQQTAKTAQHAATEVKTISQVFDVAKETAGSGWAQTFRIIFGDFEEAKKTFTAMSETINGFINKNAEARNKVLKDWKALGGRIVLIDAIKTAFHNLMLILKPIKDAFTEIFPPATGKDLFELTVQLKLLADALKPSPETIDNVKRTFKGLFAVLDIGKQIVSGIFTMFKSLFKSVDAGNGGFLSFTARIGDWLVKVDEALKKGDVFNKIFEKIGETLALPVRLIKELADVIGDLFSGFNSGGFSGGIDSATNSLHPFHAILDKITELFPKFFAFAKEMATALKPAFDAWMEFFGGIGTAIGHAASNMNFDAILTVIKTGLFAKLVFMASQFFGKGSFANQLIKGIQGGGIIKNIAGTFSALQGTMVSIQNNVKAKTLKEIAIAIGILTASVVALSFVDPEKLKKAIVAVGFMMGELLGAMAIMDKIAASKGFIKLPIVAAGMIALAGAIDVLSIAVIAMSFLSWESLAKGLSGVGALLTGISVAAIPLAKNSKGLIAAGIGIGAVAFAMNILALAVRQFSGMKWEELGKGLVGVGGGLGTVMAAMKKMPSKGLAAAGVGLVIIAGGMKLLASAIGDLGKLSIKELAKGLAAIGASLVIIGGSMRLFKVTPKMAASLILVSFALGQISKAIVTMGKLTLDEIAHGLIALGGALVILAVGAAAMTGSAAGAAAIGVVAVGLSLLVPQIIKLGSTSFETLAKGLIVLAAGLGMIIVAGVAATPAAVGLLALGAAMLLIGAGLALVGAGVFLVGAGLSAIAVAGPTALGIMIAAMHDFQEGLVTFVKDLILGLLEIVDALSDTAPKFVDALVKIINSLLDVIIKAAPKIATAVTALMQAFLKILKDNQDDIIKAAVDLIIALLKGIRNGLPDIIKVAGEIIVKLLLGLKEQLPDIIKAGVDLLVAFLKGVVKDIKTIGETVVTIITEFITAVGKGYKDIIDAGVDLLVNFLKGVGKNLRDVIDAAGDVIVEFIKGIGDNLNDIIGAGVLTIIKFIQGIGANALLLSVAAMKVILDFLNGLKVAVDIYAPAITAAALSLGWAIIAGIVKGLWQKAQDAYNAAKTIASNVLGFMSKAVRHKSPAKEAIPIGASIIDGLTKGLDDNAKNAYASAISISNGVISAFNNTFKIKSPSRVMQEIGEAVGVGFAQGIRGSREDINKAFLELNGDLKDAMQDATDTIASEQEKLQKALDDTFEKSDKLNKLRKEKKPDKEAIASALKDLKESQQAVRDITAVILLNEDILNRTTAGHKMLTETLRGTKNELLGVAKEYEGITKRLEEQEKKLADIKQARKDLVESTTAQYSILPELSTLTPEQIKAAKDSIAAAQTKLDELEAAKEKDEEAIKAQKASVLEETNKLAELVKGKILNASKDSVNVLATYEQDLKLRTAAVETYNKTLTKLRDAGIDQATYNKLVADGTADQEFATQLAKGADRTLKHLKGLDTQLINAAKKIGVNTGDQMYKSMQETQKKAVDSLRDDKHDAVKEMKTLGTKIMTALKTSIREEKDGVGDEMESVGKEMLARIKKALAMKSPSREMIEIGRLSIEGLAQGLTDNTHLISNASDQVAKDALTAMQQSMTSIHGAILDEMDANPVITPILDLTIVRGQARELANMVPATASYGQAALISASQNGSETESSDATLIGGAVKFEQNNYSPTALSEIDIYRATKNQLSQLKSVLALT